MTSAWVLALLAAQPAAAADEPIATRCLPAQDGFISMRLRGSIEQDVHWTEPGLECTGMPRPDGKGDRRKNRERERGGKGGRGGGRNHKGKRRGR